jgi:hypothetical protein
MLESIIISGFTTSYLLSLLLLENGGRGFSGFLPKRDVYFTNEEGTLTEQWRVTWVDCLRMVFNLYESRSTLGEGPSKEAKVWYIKNNQMARLWSCPYCLGFWLNVGVTILIVFTNADILNIITNADILNIFSASFLLAFPATGVSTTLYAITSAALDFSGGE